VPLNYFKEKLWHNKKMDHNREHLNEDLLDPWLTELQSGKEDVIEGQVLVLMDEVGFMPCL
jgi:hypothetical protein